MISFLKNYYIYLYYYQNIIKYFFYIQMQVIFLKNISNKGVIY